jgi:hypothetical protein
MCLSVANLIILVIPLIMHITTSEAVKLFPNLLVQTNTRVKVQQDHHIWYRQLFLRYGLSHVICGLCALGGVE